MGVINIMKAVQRPPMRTIRMTTRPSIMCFFSTAVRLWLLVKCMTTTRNPIMATGSPVQTRMNQFILSPHHHVALLSLFSLVNSMYDFSFCLYHLAFTQNPTLSDTKIEQLVEKTTMYF